MNQQMFRRGDAGTGPSTMDSRYIFEDVPYGLVSTALLGRIAGVPARLHEAGIALFSGAVGRDLAGDNDLLGPLGLEELDVRSLERLCLRGFGG